MHAPSLSDRKASQRICGRAGLTPCQNSKPGKHLPAGHPLLRKVIEHIRLQRASQQVHPLLIGNFDQVWSVNYRPRNASLQKRGHTDQLSKSMQMRKLRHRIEVALNMPVTENVETHRIRHDPKPNVIQGGSYGSNAVDAWRVPHTLTTLSWLDGSVGRGFATRRSETLTETERAAMNKAGTTCAFHCPMNHLECFPVDQ